MYEFWYDYVNQIYKEKSKLCYMDGDKNKDNDEDIAKDVGKRFDTSSNE